jgi:hypothetical protein
MRRWPVTQARVMVVNRILAELVLEPVSGIGKNILAVLGVHRPDHRLPV